MFVCLFFSLKGNEGEVEMVERGGGGTGQTGEDKGETVVRM